MRYFVAYKKVKFPRYKLWYLIFVLAVILILILNFIIIIIFNKNDNFFNMVINNSFGNVISKNINLDKYFYKNVWGIYFDNKPVFKENESLEEILVNEEEKIVYIYNTFQTDQYKSNYFNSYSVAAYVTQASFILQEYLQDLNIGSVVEEESMVKILKENNINYNNSYAASKILLQKRVIEYPNLKYYFDLQLSDYNRDTTTILVDGINYAKILFVVGTDNENYQENQKMAIKLNEILEQINKDLSRGVSLRGGSGYQGVYNQDFSSNALLIQVGGIYNTIDEVNRSLKVLAKVIATYILGDDYEEK